MTWDRRSVGVYRCDAKGCDQQAIGYLEEYPPGWKLINIDERDNWDAKVGHVCPKCATSVEQEKP